MKRLILWCALALAWGAPSWQALAAESPSAQLQPITEANHFRDPDWYQWGGSILRGEDGGYWLFYSRWPKSHGFYAWLTDSEVAVARSDSPAGPWKYQYTALKGRGGAHWDAVTAHNPKIKHFDGRYYLYYISTVGDYSDDERKKIAKTGYSHPAWSKLRNAQRTGVAVADSPAGPWKRADSPIFEPTPPLHTIVVNPAIVQRKQGDYLLMVKGDREPRRGSPRIQAVAISDSPVGPFAVQPEPAIRDFDTEDASLWYDSKLDEYRAIYHAHSHYGVITSKDGVTWKGSKHAVYHPKRFRWEDGSVFTAHRIERPFIHLGEDGEPAVFLTSYFKAGHSAILTIPFAVEEN
ncbi:glycoside hydrolase family protein [Sulfuriroseicoccus oceanibius]|uniref:Glycoside hydrolase family protein n=1 Tax=Sulfuriroseicoccus oceanibius TaxID=2707525 RepID=A0A6B3LAK9_9BACT|nr:glycoside hydrolase family protein [Sulfuriroseicoccus oceanibius]QQL45503.1 glycoside hydrolase family protein [Sulfuriroseicoccus oceanibius]